MFSYECFFLSYENELTSEKFMCSIQILVNIKFLSEYEILHFIRHLDGSGLWPPFLLQIEVFVAFLLNSCYVSDIRSGNPLLINQIG